MLTVRQFKAMADSYGADLRRWPVALRADAQVLLEYSPDARRILDEAQAFDVVIGAAGEIGDSEPTGEEIAALARLRASVSARIGAEQGSERSLLRRPFHTVLRPVVWKDLQATIAVRRGWIGMAAGSSIAIAMGLVVGLSYAPIAAADNVQSILQPAPINILAE